MHVKSHVVIFSIYNFFSFLTLCVQEKEYLGDVKHPDLQRKMGKFLGARWKLMSVEEKESYVLLAECGTYLTRKCSASKQQKHAITRRFSDTGANYAAYASNASVYHFKKQRLPESYTKDIRNDKDFFR